MEPPTSKGIVIFGATGDLCKEINSSTLQTLAERTFAKWIFNHWMCKERSWYRVLERIIG